MFSSVAKKSSLLFVCALRVFVNTYDMMSYMLCHTFDISEITSAVVLLRDEDGTCLVTLSLLDKHVKYKHVYTSYTIQPQQKANKHLLNKI